MAFKHVLKFSLRWINNNTKWIVRFYRIVRFHIGDELKSDHELDKMFMPKMLQKKRKQLNLFLRWSGFIFINTDKWFCHMNERRSMHKQNVSPLWRKIHASDDVIFMSTAVARFSYVFLSCLFFSTLPAKLTFSLCHSQYSIDASHREWFNFS